MVNQLLLLLLLLAPVGVFADYFNAGGATDSSYGMVPYSSQINFDSSISFTVAGYGSKDLISATCVAHMESVSLKGWSLSLSATALTYVFGKIGDAKRANYKVSFPAVSSLFFVVTHQANIGGGLRDTMAWMVYINGALLPAVKQLYGEPIASWKNNDRLSIGALYGEKKATSAHSFFSGSVYGVTVDSGAIWTQAQVNKYYNGGLYNPELYRGQVLHHWPLVYSTAGQLVSTFQDIGYGPKLHGAIYHMAGHATPTLGGNVIGVPTPIFLPGQE